MAEFFVIAFKSVMAVGVSLIVAVLAITAWNEFVYTRRGRK